MEKSLPKTALITGITGQDGYYLSRFLAVKGYQIYGTTRDQSAPHAAVFQSEFQAEFPDSLFHLHELDLLNQEEVEQLIREIAPDEIYHLASQSHAGHSFVKPVETFRACAISLLSLLESIRNADSKQIKLFHASSAAIFEGATESPQNEETTLSPKSPYGAAKAAGQHLVQAYRESYGIHACSGILYNHESPRRPNTFVTGKIVEAVAEIALGRREKLILGNLETGRDWGAAQDFVAATWTMLQAETPQDYIVATGKWHSLKEFLEIAFQTVGLDWQDYTESSSQFFRPTEPVRLCGDISKIKIDLGWQPQTSFSAMIEEMVREKIKVRQQLK